MSLREDTRDPATIAIPHTRSKAKRREVDQLGLSRVVDRTDGSTVPR
jgi:hypothetical protein